MIIWGGCGRLGFTYLNTGGRDIAWHGHVDGHSAPPTRPLPRDLGTRRSLDRQSNDRLGWMGPAKYFQYRREIQSRHGQLDSHQHHERALLPDYVPTASLDRQRNDRAGAGCDGGGPNLFQHRREILRAIWFADSDPNCQPQQRHQEPHRLREFGPTPATRPTRQTGKQAPRNPTRVSRQLISAS